MSNIEEILKKKAEEYKDSTNGSSDATIIHAYLAGAQEVIDNPEKYISSTFILRKYAKGRRELENLQAENERLRKGLEDVLRSPALAAYKYKPLKEIIKRVLHKTQRNDP
jgi:hypothetical protein